MPEPVSLYHCPDAALMSMPASCQSRFSALSVPLSSPRDAKGAREAAIALKAATMSVPPATLAGSLVGPISTKSLYMTSRRPTPKPAATKASSDGVSWTSSTSASPCSPSLSAWPVPTATTRTAMPVFLVKAGRRWPKRPDCSVEVVEATVMKGFSSALAGAIAGARAGTRKESRARPASREYFICFATVASNRIDEAAGFGDRGEVVVGVAEQRVDHGDALEVMADLVFVGHADAAMELDRLLADELARAAALHLGGGDNAAPLAGIRRLGHHRRQHRHAARLLERHQHVDGAMLQRLEAADGNAELLARLQVLDGELVHHAHRPDRLGDCRGDGEIDGALDDGQRMIARPEQRLGVQPDVAEGDLGGAQAVHRRVALHGDSRCLGIDKEETDAVALALAAGGARRDDEAVGGIAVQHDALGAAKDVAAAG